MPGFDGTGPRGMGPMTGGGRGFCSPWGQGRRRGFGIGVVPHRMAGRWAARWMPYQYPYEGPAYTGYPADIPQRGYGVGVAETMPGAMPFTPQMSREQELDFLKSQAEAIKEQLQQIESRVHDLEAKDE